MTTHERLIAPRILFQFAVPLKAKAPLWSAAGGGLDDSYRLLDLGQLDRQRPFADVRLAWGGEGLALTAIVRGKRQPLWCRESRPEDSDGIQVWIDTRATHNIHRASRYCHRFVFLPAGAGSQQQPVADQLIIHRARENARPIRPRDLKVQAVCKPDGYQLDGLIPAAALTGFDPEEHSRLGFTYAVYDRELGLQTYSAGPTFPYEEDPSTWATLELVR
ncbi:MAG: hypothetical protein ACC645_02520 [Pirellulales bacterium]